MKIETILQSKGTAVHAVRETDSIADAVKLLNDKNIGVVVVTGPGDKISGILSERDIVRNMADDGGAVMHAPVSRCMTPDPVTCTPESTVNELMQIMTRRRIRHVPVIDQGRLAGLISIGDVVKYKIEEAELEAAALREYIAS
jgi:CBS domain-containing protein